MVSIVSDLAYVSVRRIQSDLLRIDQSKRGHLISCGVIDQRRAQFAVTEGVALWSGSAIGSISTTVVFHAAGWGAASVLGGAYATAALSVWVIDRLRVSERLDELSCDSR